MRQFYKVCESPLEPAPHIDRGDYIIQFAIETDIAVTVDWFTYDKRLNEVKRTARETLPRHKVVLWEELKIKNPVIDYGDVC